MSDDMALQRFMPYIIVIVIWITIIVILSILYFLFPPEINYWVKVCDKCTATTGKYIYVIRFIFGSFKKTFDLSKTTVTIEITNGKQALVSFQIQPKQLVEHIPNFPNPPLKTVRLLLYRKEQLKDIKTVIVNHNGVGSISVTTIEIQDLNEKEAHISYIGAAVLSLPKDKAEISQTYPAAQRELRSIEQELKPTVSLNAKEFVIFVCLALNIMLIFTVYVIPCPQQVFCGDYRAGFLSSVYSGLLAGTVAALVMAIFCAIHRYLIKKALYKGIAICSYFRFGILIFVILISLVLGLIAAIMASQNSRFPKTNATQKYFHEIFWMFAFSIAILIFFLFWMSSLSIIARMTGFFTEPEEIKVDIKPEMADITLRSPDVDNEKEGSDYMSQLIKANTKVKSISQYGGLNQKKSVVQPSGKREPSDGKVKRAASNESTGSGYYKQLMKGQTKVKSVSQYKGVNKK